MNKLAIITGFLGKIENRFLTYKKDRSLQEKFELAASIKNLDGLEVCYPRDFGEFKELINLFNKYELGVSAVNFRSRRNNKWFRGSFTSEKASERKEVVKDLKKAMDFAEELGCNRVTTCPLNEGHDYIFEMNYKNAFKYFKETIQKAASYNPEVKICLEYKPNGPRARSLLGNAGETLSFCQSLNVKNVGVTLDIGHSLLAGERPAQSVVMLAQENRLFYIHLNDNDKYWDWDMVPGAYNLWDFIEFFYYLDQVGYEDWIAYDVFPKEISTKKTFETTIKNTYKINQISKNLDKEKIRKLHNNRDPVESIEYLFSLI